MPSLGEKRRSFELLRCELKDITVLAFDALIADARIFLDALTRGAAGLEPELTADVAPRIQNLRLSNYAIRAYDERSGRVALHVSLPVSGHGGVCQRPFRCEGHDSSTPRSRCRDRRVRGSVESRKYLLSRLTAVTRE